MPHTKQTEVMYIYMGKFNKWSYKAKKGEKRINTNKGKYYYFSRFNDNGGFHTLIVKSPSRNFVEAVSKAYSVDYDKLFYQLERTIDYSPYYEDNDEFIPYSFEEFNALIDKSPYFTFCYIDKKEISINFDYSQKTYIVKKYGETIDDKITILATGSLKEIFSKLKFTKIQRYLANGKVYDRGW